MNAPAPSPAELATIARFESAPYPAEVAEAALGRNIAHRRDALLLRDRAATLRAQATS